MLCLDSSILDHIFLLQEPQVSQLPASALPKLELGEACLFTLVPAWVTPRQTHCPPSMCLVGLNGRTQSPHSQGSWGLTKGGGSTTGLSLLALSLPPKLWVVGRPVAGSPTHLTCFLVSESLAPLFLLFLPRCLCPAVSASLSLCLLVSLHLSEFPCLSLPSGPLLSQSLPISLSFPLFGLWTTVPLAPPLCPLSPSLCLSAAFALDLYSQLLTLGPPPPLFPRSSEQKWDEGWRGREGKSQWGEKGQPDRLGSLGIFVRAPPSTTQPAHL